MTAAMQDTKYETQLFLTPRVPQGLAAAVESLTREVIRQRPENIYVFAAHHFENLMKLREQYDDVGVNNNNKTAKTLREMNEAIKERQTSTESNAAAASGWSLNETAKVLERHRSIFGETGQKMSTEQVRELASSKIGGSSPKRRSEETPRANGVSKGGGSSRKRESVNFGKTDSKHVSKIISQIPIAKDIKTELKKNRIRSRERKKVEEKKMQVACEYSRETTIEKTVKRSVERTKRSSFESRSEQRRSWQTEDLGGSKRKSEPGGSEAVPQQERSPKLKKTTSSSRSVSMDSVKNYVVQNLAGMSSLDELQSPSYVEKVQEVIDETSTIIQEKLEALKTGVRKASRMQSKAERLSGSDDSRDSDKSAGQKSREENLFAAKSSQEDSEDNIAGSAQDRREQSAAEPETKDSALSDSSNESKISLPAVRPLSSKSTSRSHSARSDPDGLILPPISPESTKSPKVKEELVLPVLSPPRSSAVSPDVSLDTINFNEKNERRSRANSVEEYHDSLNVTPDLLDAPPRPDSLENPEVLELGGQESPLETLKDKLVEIEQVQKRIEGVLDETISSDDKSREMESSAKEIKDSATTLNIQDKLLEIQESEKRIEQILDAQSTPVEEESTTANSDIKSKLQELADAEKRIENIFINKANGEPSKETAANETKVGVDSTSDKKIDDPKESRGNNALEKVSGRNPASEVNEAKQIKTEETPRSNRLLSPHSYILTEGSPNEIPDSVTRVIIPDRSPSPDSDILQIDLNNDQMLITSSEENQSETENKEEKNNLHEAFGEPVKTLQVEPSIVEDDFIRGIRDTHDQIIPRKDLDLIKEEREREAVDTEAIDSEDEKVLKVVTTSLEEILERDEVEYVTKEEVTTKIEKAGAGKEEADDLSPDVANPAEYESTDETKETSITDAFVENTDVVENSLDIEETTERSAESTNEIKETSIATDRSTLSFDPAIPLVPELNLDSLPDLTISSFNITDDEQKDEVKSKRSSSSENLLSSDSAKYHLSLDNKIVEEKSLADDNRRETNSKSTVEKSAESHEKVINENTSESIAQITQDNISLTEKNVEEEKDKITSTEKKVEEKDKISSTEKKIEEEKAKISSTEKKIEEEKAKISSTEKKIEEEKDKISSTEKEFEEKEVEKNVSEHKEELKHTAENVVSETSGKKESAGNVSDSKYENIDKFVFQEETEKEVISSTIKQEEIKNNETIKSTTIIEKDIKTNDTTENTVVKEEEIKANESSSMKKGGIEINDKEAIESTSISTKETRNDSAHIKTASIPQDSINKDDTIDEILSIKDEEIRNDNKFVETSLVAEKEIKQYENKTKRNEIVEGTKIHEEEIKKDETKSETIEESNVEQKSEKHENFEEIINITTEYSVTQILTTENIKTKLISEETSKIQNESLEKVVTEESTLSKETKNIDEVSRGVEIHDNEERSNSALAIQIIPSTYAGDDVKLSSSLDSADVAGQIIEQSRLGVIGNNDESSQLADSSRVSSQCTSTARLDSDDPSIKTNTGASAQRSNQSEDAEAARDEEQTIAGIKSSDRDFREADEALAAAANQSEQQSDEKKNCHVYVPETSVSRDLSSSSESSTFMSAATKIQAGVRGFLTRRRLQSTQRRSSTLDSVPSIQESFAVESPDSSEDAAATATRALPTSQSLLQPPAQNGSLVSEAKARKKLRREDAVQRTTLSVENAFAENQLQHTGEFHDGIPLPVFDSEALSLKLDRAPSPPATRPRGADGQPEASAAVVEQLLEKMLLDRGPGPFVDVLLLPGDPESMLQSRYLNFITSVEDVTNELFDDAPKGLIIEEITSLDESKFNEVASIAEDRSTASKDESSERTSVRTENESSVAPEASNVTGENKKEPPEKDEALSVTSDVSMNIEEVLDLGEEDYAGPPKSKQLPTRLTGADAARSSSASQESHLSERERTTRSPVTMMQIAPRSVEERSDKSERSGHSAELPAEAGSMTAKEDTSAEEKEQESPTETKTNEPADAPSS